jgi:hypothetical protein
MENMKKPSNSLRKSVSAHVYDAVLGAARVRRGLIGLVLAAVSLTVAATPLRAQPARSLSLPPSITIVGTVDNACQESVAEIQRFVREFAFVRGHSIYVVCDAAAWRSALHHLTLEYGVIVSSRGAISDLHLRETWFYAAALRKGVDHRTGEEIYAHELGHFACSCIEEAAADRAGAQLLEDARRNRFTAASRPSAAK